MNSNTLLLVFIAGAAIVGLLAYESYVASQNSLATQIGKGVGAGLGSVLGGLI